MYTVGADPEFFVADRQENLPVSACGKIGGTKGAPLPLSDEVGILEDGDAVEFNIKPANTAKELASTLKQMFVLGNRYLEDKGLSIYQTREAAQHIDSELKEFGCALDNDAYNNGLPRPSPMAEAMHTHGNSIRFVGGHIHFGFEKKPNIPLFVQVRLADLFVGLYLSRQRENLRHHYYGKPGLYREKSYGFEYRTPEPYWCYNDYRAAAAKRIFLFAAILAHSDKYMSDLVQLYNTINWAAMPTAMMGLAHPPVDNVVINGVQIPIGSWIPSISESDFLSGG